MLGLRQKLLLGFGGLLIILLLVSGLGVAVLRQHRNALDKFLYENWRSVEYGQAIINDLPHLDEFAKNLSGETGQPDKSTIDAAVAAAAPVLADLSQNVDAEDHNITLVGEDDDAANLTKNWSGVDIHSGQKITADNYRDTFGILTNVATTPADRVAAYAALQRLSPQVRTWAQEVINLNFKNMTPVEGKIKDLSDSAAHVMIALAIVGIAMAILLTAVVSRSILTPLGTLTRSLREVGEGNLDLVVTVKSRDELYQLAEAFNTMASRLREFRRTDRAKLLRTQRTTQLAVNSLPDAIAIVNPGGIIELSNETAQKLFSLKPDESIKNLTEKRITELYDQVSREVRPSQAKGYESAIEVYDQGGQLRFFLPRAIPILDADQHLLGVTLVMGDVTNLRRLDEMKSGLLSVVSHELKTPLTSIRMAAHLLLEERVGPLNTKQTELLMAARDDSDRLQKIIEDLLDMGRLESGRVKMDLRSEPSERLVSDAVAPMETAFHDRCIALEVDVPVETPPVLVDPARIDHVFSNLLTNALKFTARGGRVRIYAEPAERFVKFVVEDTGVGIPAEHLGRIFERFYRVPSSSEPGAGLGLAIAKEIIEAHGGTISVQSMEGQWSKFSFTLQRADLAKKPESEDQYETSIHISNG
jgi:two-component system, NtrC family, sensor histidine kinase KinB